MPVRRNPKRNRSKPQYEDDEFVYNTPDSLFIDDKFYDFQEGCLGVFRGDLDVTSEEIIYNDEEDEDSK